MFLMLAAAIAVISFAINLIFHPIRTFGTILKIIGWIFIVIFFAACLL